jgi:ubiquinol-cytochrome c reductase cytochrome b subunit
MATTLLRRAVLLAVLVVPFVPPWSAGADQARARDLLNSQGCKGCHFFEQSGGGLGPPLNGVGKRLNREQLRLQLVKPQNLHPGGLMPSFSHLDDVDLEALVDFLANLR